MTNAILEVENLTKHFGPETSGFTAVDHISFSLEEGEILGVLGPNGAGKTTTMQMLLGVMDPSFGNIHYFNKPFDSHREEILKQINFASTYINLPWQFSVIEILDIFARLYGIPEREKRIEKLLVTFELEELKKRKYYQLSAGERTRLVIAKAFLNYPKLILLDEPTASLDPEIAQKIRDFLLKQKYEHNVSILLTSHNMAEVEEMCDRILVLNHGKIVDEGTPEVLMKKISTCEIELSVFENIEKLITLLKEREIYFSKKKYFFTISLTEKDIASFLALLAKEKITYEEISIKKPDLEDYFLQTIERSKKD